MQAIILAGGFGTRLRPFTYTRAKSLLPILNKPMIVYLIEMLPDEVDTVILAVNYRKDQIKQYFKEHDFGKKIIINDESKPLGTGGAVKFAARHLTDTFLVFNSDIVCSLDVDKMIRFHREHHAVATISLWPVKNVSEFGVVDIQNDGNVVDFVEKPKPEDAPSNLINAGAYFLEPEILNYIETGRLVSMEKEIFPQIIKDTGKFFGFEFKGYWIDVGRIKSYIDVHKFLIRNKKLSFFEGKNCEIHGQTIDSSLGDNVLVGKNSALDSVVILNNTNIGKNVILDNCVIGENCEIGDSSKLTNTVVGDNEIVEKNVVLDNTIVWSQPVPKGYPKKQIGNVLGE